MVSATLALVGLFVALYLWLWRIGLLGSLACGAGDCEIVQLSEHAQVLGLPVALYGVVGYAAILGVSLLGLQPRWAARQAATIALVVLAGLGVLFTTYLTYLEAAVIRAWCRWCLVSAGIITAIFVTAVMGLKQGR